MEGCRGAEKVGGELRCREMVIGGRGRGRIAARVPVLENPTAAANRARKTRRVGSGGIRPAEPAGPAAQVAVGPKKI